MTYKQARQALLAHLATLEGWTVKPSLKVPQAIMPSGDVLRFNAQSVILNAHSMWIDIRKETPVSFLAELDRTRGIRSGS